MTAGALALLLAASAGAAELIWDMESDDGGFRGATVQWAYGELGGGPGPEAAHSGSYGWATVPDGLYLNDFPDFLTAPAVDLGGYQRPVLRWWQWLELAAGDSAQIEVFDGDSGEWLLAEPIYGYGGEEGFDGGDPAWREVYVDLSGLGDLSELRLAFYSDDQVQAAGWYVDDFALADGDVVPPLLSELTVLGDSQDVAGPYPVSVRAADDVAVQDVLLYYRAGDAGYAAAAMSEDGEGLWSAAIPGQAPDTSVAYYVEASDGSNLALLPADAPLEFRVYLPAPTDLSGPEGRLVAREATLSWTPPGGEQAVEGYTVWRGEEAVAEVAEPLASVALDPEDNTYTVSASFLIDGLRYEGDRSEALALEVAWPEVLGLAPDYAYQGDSARVAISGANLLMVQGDLSLELGEGISVSALEVRDVDYAVATLAIDEGAAIGARDLRLVSGALELVVPGIFEVLDGAERPQLISVEPDTLEQGESGELIIATAGELGEDISVDLGEGVVVESVQREGDTLRVAAVVEPSAALGDRAVIVDDGLRILSGPTLSIEDRLISTEKTCSAAGGGGGWLLWVLGLLLCLRRSGPPGAGRPPRRPPAGSGSGPPRTSRRGPRDRPAGR